MITTINDQENTTKNDEHKLPCLNCSGKTLHIVLASIDRKGKGVEGSFEYYWDTNYQIIECKGCQTISFRSLSSNSEEYYPYPEDDKPVEFQNLYPARLEGRKSIEHDLHYLPFKVKSIYSETIAALTLDLPIIAGIGLRAIIETVCKNKHSTGKNLYEKIDDLVKNDHLTPSGAKILHEIRTLGNDAAHDVESHTSKQLSLAMDITEHLISEIYILPKKVKQSFPTMERGS